MIHQLISQKTILLIGSFVTLVVATTDVSYAQFEFNKGDRICLVGNAFGERMQHQNYFETLLHQSHPQHNLAVRNLCFPGDEPLQRERSQNFGSPDDHLTHSKASVVVFVFGFNESFAGKMGLPKFKADMKRLISETKKEIL